MVTFAEVRSSALAINKLCGGLSIEFDFAEARTVAHDQMGEIFQRISLTAVARPRTRPVSVSVMRPSGSGRQ
jgi:hypothetical protein